MAKFFLVLTLIAAGAAAGLGWVTYQKISDVKTTLKKTTDERDATKHELNATKITLKQAQDDLSAAKTQLDTANATIATDKTTIDGLNKDKTDLQAKADAATAQATTLTGSLDAANKKIDELNIEIHGTKPGVGPAPEGPVVELKKKVDELTQINNTLTDKVTKLQKEKDAHDSAMKKPGIEGMVMAVNPGYGFAVVSVGDRQGSVPNAELIVSRDGRQIAKLKVTTVEPALSVADIEPDSVAKGQRILPGDKVIFSGNMAQ